MKKYILIIIVVIVVIVGAVVFFVVRNGNRNIANTPTPVGGTENLDPKNATYQIEGKAVTLVNGVSETPTAPGSAEMAATRYFGNGVTGDFNGDGLTDLCLFNKASGAFSVAFSNTFCISSHSA